MADYKCNKCNKSFESPSKLKRHQNRKIPCDSPKKEYKCDICKVRFISPAQQKIHENTKKHITNYNIHINGNNNIVGDNNIQNIINLTLNTRTFSNSNVGLVSNLSIELVYGIFDNIINNKHISNSIKVLNLFKEAVIFILDTLHFNILNTENHNLKILLMFPKIEKLVYEYLILEINQESNDLVWNSISYDQLLDEIFNLLKNINAKNITQHRDEIREQNITFDKFINFLKLHLLLNEETKNELKPEIEMLLGSLYIQFNKNQKKENREIKINILDKINEYKNYRNNECRLSNGFTPNIINSSI
jgi:DNA-directed RNA polymerase subunit RPC12/RpoP